MSIQSSSHWVTVQAVWKVRVSGPSTPPSLAVTQKSIKPMYRHLLSGFSFLIFYDKLLKNLEKLFTRMSTYGRKLRIFYGVRRERFRTAVLTLCGTRTPVQIIFEATDLEFLSKKKNIIFIQKFIFFITNYTKISLIIQ